VKESYLRELSYWSVHTYLALSTGSPSSLRWQDKGENDEQRAVWLPERFAGIDLLW